MRGKLLGRIARNHLQTIQRQLAIMRAYRLRHTWQQLCESVKVRWPGDMLCQSGFCFLGGTFQPSQIQRALEAFDNLSFLVRERDQVAKIDASRRFLYDSGNRGRQLDSSKVDFL